MKEIEQFFGESSVRFITYNGKKWINANDCAAVLEYKNPTNTILQFVESNKILLGEETQKICVSSVQNKKIYQWFFSEHGLLTFLIKTNQPKAIPFQKWAISVLHDAIVKSKAPKQKTLRMKSKEARNFFTDALMEHGVTKQHEFIQMTYQTKIGLGIDKNKKKNDCDPMELCKIMMTEILSTYEMEARGLDGYHEIKPAVLESGGIVKQIPMTIIQKQIEG